jgi:dCTP deaminase
MILLGSKIRELMAQEFPHKLVVTPMLAPNDQLNDGSVGVDVRLGQDFLVMRTSGVETIDPADLRATFESQVGRSQQRVHVPIGDAFILHPGRFALGATLEYIRLPDDLAAYVIGRSSWARVGLVIAMATAVHPGFAGVLTLELQNLGDVPLSLYPGARIAQLIFHTARGRDEAQVPGEGATSPGSYSCSTGPGVTALRRDPEWDRLRRIQQRRATSTH